MEISRCHPDLPAAEWILWRKFRALVCMSQCILAEYVQLSPRTTSALWDWQLLPFRSTDCSWCPVKFRSRAELKKPSSKSQILSPYHLMAWLGICLVLWMWCNFFLMALLDVTGFHLSKKEIGWVRSVWYRNWQLHLPHVWRVMWEGQHRRWQKMSKSLWFLPASIFVTVKLCYPNAAIQVAGGDPRRYC